MWFRGWTVGFEGLELEKRRIFAATSQAISKETVVLIAKRTYRTVWLTRGTDVVVSGGCGTNAGAQLPSQKLIARSLPSLYGRFYMTKISIANYNRGSMRLRKRSLDLSAHSC
jgi:hypothetical protein